jgi:cobalt-zinc-cadmium resistance protein CzcA
VLNGVIDFSLRHRFAVILTAAVCAAAGGLALAHLDVDAFPDTTPVQVQVNTAAPALTPEEVERQITASIEQKIGGMPRLRQLRSVSKFGLSQVVVTFEDGTDVYFARQLVNERLGTVELPPGVARPTLGPVSTGLGEVFHYLVSSPGYDLSELPEPERVRILTELRTAHDWLIRPKLRAVPGVAEVNSWGGYEKQYQVRVDPVRLVNHGLTFDEVVGAVEKNNRNVGGGSVRKNTQMLLVHGVGRVADPGQIRDIPVAAQGGVPVRVGDVADVEVGHEIRRGAVTADGRGEAVLGLGFMLAGENSHVVTRELKKKLEEIKETLPPGVQVEAVYDRTELVDFVIGTARNNLFEGGLLVVAVLLLFLGNLRAAAVVALAIPLSMLFAFSGMLRFGIAASLLSLGAIDFGMVVDSSVVMVENCVRHVARGGRRGRTRRDVVRQAAVEVRRPTLYGELIIMVVYLPILTLEGVEGKLFRPMALTVIFALAGSMVLSLTLMPVLASLVLPRRLDEREPLLMRLARRLYAPVLRFTMRHKLAVLGVTFGVLLVAFSPHYLGLGPLCRLGTQLGLFRENPEFFGIAPTLGSEFVPRLSEGALAVGVVRLAGTDLNESVRMNTRMEKAVLAAFPDEVAHVWSRTGTAEVATDPMGVELTDLFITLRPRDRWHKARTQAELTGLIERELRQLPGQAVAFSQPIEMRVNEMTSGVRSDLAVKLFGDDLDVLKAKAVRVKEWLEAIPGAADVSVEQVTGQPVLRVRVKQDELARYGVPAKAVLDLVESLGSKPLGEVVEGPYRVPLAVRLPEGLRGGKEAVEGLLVATPAGERLPLSRLAEVEEVEGPSTVTREWGQRRVVVTCNVRGRDLGSFAAEAQRAINADTLKLQGRYHLEWGGQFENYERARRRLLLVVPLAGALIFGLLFTTYRNVVDALRVFTGVPLGWVGGLAALWLRDMPLSISAIVGFIAMSGVAVLDDMILVSAIRQLRARGLPVDRAVSEAALTRLRPVLMTTLVASLGFLPMAFSTGMGAEVQRPLATVVIGGVISAMVMSLLVIRVLYVLFDEAARAAQWALTRWFGLRAEQLAWLFGGHGEEDGEWVGAVSRNEPGATPAKIPEQAHA